MGKTNKGLHTKVINVFDPESDEEFEIYVTFEKFNNNNFSDDFAEFSYISREDIDIKHYESNSDEDIPFWVSEDLIYDYLIDELESEMEMNENEDFYEEDDEFSEEKEEDW
jgi:hypothetical protein